jgi:DNA-binding NarL/FixJ family response regulator
MLGKASALLASIKTLPAVSPSAARTLHDLPMHDEEVYATRALQAGAHGYLMKGADSDTLDRRGTGPLQPGGCLGPRVQSEILSNMAAGHPVNAAGNLSALTQSELAILQMLGSGQRCEGCRSDAGPKCEDD